MEWHISDAQSLSLIDHEIGEHTLSPAEYEIVRRVIYATADFEYQSLIHFSEQALQSGATALAARSTIVVDVPMVQAGILATLQKTFANPVYCGMEALTRPQKQKSQSAWGIETLAHRYPEGIFVIGESQTVLGILVDLIEKEEINPALIIDTSPRFIEVDSKRRLQNTWISHIYIQGRKGNAVVAAAILNTLAELSWQAYRQQD
jgi:precorrin-8X/cobalt-precorrin-8 methylmutase